MNYLDIIEFISCNNKLKLGFNNLIHQKLLLIKYSVMYVKEKNNRYYMANKAKFEELQKVEPVNWQTKKLPGYNILSKSEYVDISLKSLKYLPTNIPLWMFYFGLSGVWWVLKVQKDNIPLTYGQCLDITSSLLKLDVIARKQMCDKVNDNWFCAMKNYFMEVIKKGDSVVFHVKN